MKKFYFLLITLLITTISFSQEMLLNGNFESWDDANTPTGWTHVENITQESTEIYGGTYSAMHVGGGTQDLGQRITGIIPGETYTLTIWYKVVENDGSDSRIWSVWALDSTNNYTDDGDALRGPNNGYLDNNGGVWTSYTATVTAPTDVNELYFEVRTYTGATTYWDDFSFFKEAPSACGVILGTETFSCSSNTIGDNNDGVTINIPYTGSNAGITSVTTTTSGAIGGDNPATVADGTITITGLSEGDAWDLILNGGDCDGTTTSGTVVADQCDPAPNTCFDLSAGSELFELVTATPNSDADEWVYNAGTYIMNGYCGTGCTDEIETWLVFGPLDMASVTDLALAFDATEQFGVTDLVVAYTSAYSGCPSGTSWTTAQTLTDSGSYDVDLSTVTGTQVFIGIQYVDDGVDSYSSWSLSNVALEAFGSCPTLGTRPTSNCAVCDLSLQTQNYVCITNTAGDNNDSVTIEIPYTGSENTITSIITTSGGTIAGDDPATTAEGTITITGLMEGASWDLTINGGDCDGTTVSGTIPASLCVPALTLPITEDFSYPDGSLVGNGQWKSSGGTLGDLQVSSGQALVQHGTPDEDAYLPFTSISGNIYFGIDFSVIDPGTGPIPGTDNEYFAHFKDDGFNYAARLDIVPPSGSGDYSVGIASDQSTADAVWATDLSYGTTYRAIVRYNQDTNIAELWIDATSESDTSILGADQPDPGDVVSAFGLRQSDSDLNEGILVDNLKVSQSFMDATLRVERDAINGFNIYPNPVTNGKLTINTFSNTEKEIQIYNILGKQVLSTKLKGSELNVKKLTSGIYILKILEDGKTATRKLVIK